MSQLMNESIDIGPFLFEHIQRATVMVHELKNTPVGKARAIGYMWGLIHSSVGVSLPDINAKHIILEQSEYEEMTRPITSQWKLDMLFGRKMALYDLRNFIAEQSRNQTGESHGSNH